MVVANIELQSFKYFKLNHYTSISETGAAEKTGLPKVSIATDKTDKTLV